MRGLSIDIATAAERTVVENLVQLYIHDFSELYAGTPRGDLGPDGRYVVDIPLERWWGGAADHVPLLLRVEGRLAGFALLNASAHGRAAVDHNIAEYFVVRKYRRTGVGTAAAHAIFSRRPGRWEAAVMRQNLSARVFWERCIRSHPQATGIEIADRNNFTWNGAIFRWVIAPD